MLETACVKMEVNTVTNMQLVWRGSPSTAGRRIHLEGVIADSVHVCDGCEHQVPGEGEGAGPGHIRPIGCTFWCSQSPIASTRHRHWRVV